MTTYRSSINHINFKALVKFIIQFIRILMFSHGAWEHQWAAWNCKEKMYLTVCRNYANKVNYVLVIFSMLKWMRIISILMPYSRLKDRLSTMSTLPFYLTNLIHLLQWISIFVSFWRRISNKRTKQLSFSVFYLSE